MTDVFLTTAGLLVSALGVWETFMAVLHPRAVVGPVTKAINRIFHDVIRARFIRPSPLIVFSGPILLVTQTICWASLLVFGISLVVWPQLGTGIISSGTQPTDQSFVTAFYYAGFTITTLGVGDLVPTTAWTKISTVTAAGLGFSFFTLVLAYVIAIYSALARRNQFACEIDFRTQRTGNAIIYLKPHVLSGDWSLLQQDLNTLSSNLAELLESHHFYPALHYFRFSESRYAMSQMLRFCLEVSTILRALRATKHLSSPSNPEPIDRIWNASMQMLDDAERHFVICTSNDHFNEPQVADQFVSQVFEVDHDVQCDDTKRFAASYETLCQEWAGKLHALEHCSYSHPRQQSNQQQ
ncbi:potassium channel family protein [Stieleria magnilauensis]|uniref:Ion channel n=1 Tax=Stieleria magnilauensis TaxID=2527963 RepID=A0ABX5XQ46_9BACT|nr:Ion channel [Planctomycetes bacterium TBK1r]